MAADSIDSPALDPDSRFTNTSPGWSSSRLVMAYISANDVKCLLKAGFVISKFRVTSMLFECVQKTGTDPRTWTRENSSHPSAPTEAVTIHSVSVKIATLPSSSIPLELYRVPACLTDLRDITDTLCFMPPSANVRVSANPCISGDIQRRAWCCSSALDSGAILATS